SRLALALSVGVVSDGSTLGSALCFCGRGMRYASSFVTNVRRGMPRSLAARLWLPAHAASASTMRWRSCSPLELGGGLESALGDGAALAACASLGGKSE